MDKPNFSYGSFFKGIAIGGVLASVVVLFTAPYSGADTRQKFQEKGIQLREQSMSTLEDARKQMDIKISETLDQVDLVMQRLGRQLDVISHQSQSAAEANEPDV